MAELVLELTTDRRVGAVVRESVLLDAEELHLSGRRLVSVSANIVKLRRVQTLWLHDNALREIPLGVLAMTQLQLLAMADNRLAHIADIACLRNLTILCCWNNRLTAVPREIRHLKALEVVSFDANRLPAVPSELGSLTSLRELWLRQNRLRWLPAALDRLSASASIFLNENPLPIDVGGCTVWHDSRARLSEIYAVTTTLAMIRDEASALCVGLAELELPALVTLEIVDAAFPNAIRMSAKWDLIAAVKHFHERR